VIKTNTTFSAPAVAVNAFNRTQTLNDLYVSVFSPKTTFHWPGNVKKYKVVNGVVVDSTGAAAVDANTGFFKDTAQSYWSSMADGADVTLGGAASKLPDAAVRTVYTFMGANPAAGSPAALTPLTDTVVTATDLQLGATDPMSPSSWIGPRGLTLRMQCRRPERLIHATRWAIRSTPNRLP